jgi:putative membrane protein
MKRIFLAVCGLSLCCLPALAQGHASMGKTMSDQEFINMAAQTDMMEAHLGQMAADQTSSQDVKTYAQMLIADHTGDYQQLQTLATKDNLTVPSGLDAAHLKMIAPFDKLKGAAFDSKYASMMVAGHTQAIGVYTKESSNAQSADVKAYATATLPTLQKHLDGAKDLSKKPAK